MRDNNVCGIYWSHGQSLYLIIKNLKIYKSYKNAFTHKVERIIKTRMRFVWFMLTSLIYWLLTCDAYFRYNLEEFLCFFYNYISLSILMNWRYGLKLVYVSYLAPFVHWNEWHRNGSESLLFCKFSNGLHYLFEYTLWFIEIQFLVESIHWPLR